MAHIYKKKWGGGWSKAQGQRNENNLNLIQVINYYLQRALYGKMDDDTRDIT